ECGFERRPAFGSGGARQPTEDLGPDEIALLALPRPFERGCGGAILTKFTQGADRTAPRAQIGILECGDKGGARLRTTEPAERGCDGALGGEESRLRELDAELLHDRRVLHETGEPVGGVGDRVRILARTQLRQEGVPSRVEAKAAEEPAAGVEPNPRR